MTAVDPFNLPIPEGFKAVEGAVEYLEYLTRMLNDLRDRTGAGVDTVAATSDTVDTQGGQLTDLETAMDLIATGSPTYAPSNDSTDRTWNANAAVAGTGVDVDDAWQVDVSLLSDHDDLVAVVQELSDVIATQARDLAAKNIFAT